MKANWFVGLPIEGGWMPARVPAPPPEVRLFAPEDLHLTIAFLGACGEARAREAWAATGAFSPIDAGLAEVVPMGPERRYSALSTLLDRGREDVERAIGTLRDPICAAAGARRDDRPPKAHLTIARPTRRASPAERRAAIAWAAAIDLRSVAVRIDRIALYTWSEDRAARLFRIVEERPLGPP